MSRHHDRIKNDPRWKAARLETLERDAYTCTCTGCAVCGHGCTATEALEVDHVEDLATVLDTAPELAWELENLRTLCRPCHQEKDTTAATTRNPWVHPAWPELAALALRHADGS